jgi:hypothetical protein
MKTKEIFTESMKLSDAAWKEKGEALKIYQEWLEKEWDFREENNTKLLIKVSTYMATKGVVDISYNELKDIIEKLEVKDDKK